MCEQKPALHRANLLRIRTRSSLRILNSGAEDRMDARKSTRLRGGRRGRRTRQLGQRLGLWPVRRTGRRCPARCAPAQCSCIAGKKNSVVATCDRVLRNTRRALRTFSRILLHSYSRDDGTSELSGRKEVSQRIFQRGWRAELPAFLASGAECFCYTGFEQFGEL